MNSSQDLIFDQKAHSKQPTSCIPTTIDNTNAQLHAASAAYSISGQVMNAQEIAIREREALERNKELLKRIEEEKKEKEERERLKRQEEEEKKQKQILETREITLASAPVAAFYNTRSSGSGTLWDPGFKRKAKILSSLFNTPTIQRSCWKEGLATGAVLVAVVLSACLLNPQWGNSVFKEMGKFFLSLAHVSSHNHETQRLVGAATSGILTVLFGGLIGSRFIKPESNPQNRA